MQATNGESLAGWASAQTPQLRIQSLQFTHRQPGDRHAEEEATE